MTSNSFKNVVKLNNLYTVSIAEFGATGANATLDSAAFLAFQTWAIAKGSSAKIVLSLDPGVTYLVSDPRWPMNITNLTVNGNGATIKNASTSNFLQMLLYPAAGLTKNTAGFYTSVDFYRIATTAIGNTSVTTIVAANAGNFSANEMVLIASLDQQFVGQPPNFKYFDYAKVTAVNSSTGVVSLDRPVRYAHQSDFPYLSSFANGDGRACVYKIEQASKFAIQHIYNDVTFAANDTFSGISAVTVAAYTSGESVTFNRCVGGFNPSINDVATFNDCFFKKVDGNCEIDKLIRLLTYTQCRFDGQLTEATSIEHLTLDRCFLSAGTLFSPRNLHATDCTIIGTPELKIFTLPDAWIFDRCSMTAAPFVSQTTTQTTTVTLGSGGASYAGNTLTLTGFAPYSSAALMASNAIPGTTLTVTAASGGKDAATGVYGVVKSISGADGVASIVVPFNGAIAGTEQITLFISPLRGELNACTVNGLPVDRKYFTFPGEVKSRFNPLTSAFFQGGNTGRGRIVKAVVDVQRPYTGATVGNILMSLQATFPVYLQGLNLDVDLRTAGCREATTTGFSGWSQGAATLGAITAGAAYTNGVYASVQSTRVSGPTGYIYPKLNVTVSGNVVTAVTIATTGSGFYAAGTVLTVPAASIGGTGSGFSIPIATISPANGETAGAVFAPGTDVDTAVSLYNISASTMASATEVELPIVEVRLTFQNNFVDTYF